MAFGFLGPLAGIQYLHDIPYDLSFHFRTILQSNPYRRRPWLHDRGDYDFWAESDANFRTFRYSLIDLHRFPHCLAFQ